MNYHGCKDCKKRYLGCHDKCDTYQNFKKECLEISEERKKRQTADEYFLGKQSERNKIWIKERKRGRK